MTENWPLQDKEALNPQNEKPAYQKTYDIYWKYIVENESGHINYNQVKKELYDYQKLMENIVSIFAYITGKKHTKPLTDPELIKSMTDRHFENIYKEIHGGDLVNQYPPGREKLCIDIDGVICVEDTNSYHHRVPVTKARESIAKLRSKYFIVLNTGRHIDKAEITIQWLQKHHIQYDLIQFGKPPAMAYIDDRARRFQDWDTIMKEFWA